MTGRDFCFWLQGFFELTGDSAITQEQANSIRRHLALVFKHEIDPSMGDATTQTSLSAVHDGPQIGGTGPGGVLYRC